MEVGLKGAHVAICVPCYTGKVPIEWAAAFSATQGVLAAHGVRNCLVTSMNSGLVHMARNELVHRALAIPGTTHILFIDDDIVWKSSDVLRLLAWGQRRPFVCGVYTGRTPEPSFTVDLVAGASGKLVKSEEGLLRSTAVPAGFMLLRREVFENPEMLALSPPSSPRKGDLKGQLVHGFFDYLQDGLSALGEDISFCRRWTRAGGEIWVDASIVLQHIGATAYCASFIDYLNKAADKKET